LWDKYLTNDYDVTNEIFGRYTIFLLDGFTLQNKKSEAAGKIIVSTIKGYLRVVNKHYKEQKYREPWDPNDDSDASKLLRAQEKFESEPAKRAPLNSKMIVEMCRQAKQDPLGFHACTFQFTGIGRFGGFRQQEFAMDSRTQIKHYILPDGSSVVRAFTVKNFIFYDPDGVRIASPLTNRARALALGTEFDVQKNRMNKQIIKHAALPAHPEYCPVRLGLLIVARAQFLGKTDPLDPLCVYKDDKGEVKYLTGTDVTAYFRDIMRTVMPNISDEELKLISTHSIRVYACVLLHEAGKDGPYIKIRLRWLSNCFEVYLRNTDTIMFQHMDALSDVHTRMAAMAINAVGGHDEAVFVQGNVNLVMDDLEDED